MAVSKHLLGIIGAGLMCLSACGTTGADGRGAGQIGSAGAPELAAGGQLLPLSFQISGGFAGRREALDITADGLATWSDMRNLTTRSAPLPPLDFARLRALLSEIPGAVIAESGQKIPGRCRDCFEYHLIFTSRIKPLKIVILSDRLADSTYRNLISLLLAIGDDVKRENP